MSTIKLDIKSIEGDAEQCRSGMPIWGKIYLETNDCIFPSKDWYDAVSSILDMWLSVMVDFVRMGGNSCELYFIDGPYKIRIDRVSGGEISVAMFNASKKVAINTCCFNDFLETLLNSADTFCHLCNEKKLSFTYSKTYSKIEANRKLLKDM